MPSKLILICTLTLLVGNLTILYGYDPGYPALDSNVESVTMHHQTKQVPLGLWNEIFINYTAEVHNPHPITVSQKFGDTCGFDLQVEIYDRNSADLLRSERVGSACGDLVTTESFSRGITTVNVQNLLLSPFNLTFHDRIFKFYYGESNQIKHRYGFELTFDTNGTSTINSDDLPENWGEPNRFVLLANVGVVLAFSIVYIYVSKRK